MIAIFWKNDKYPNRYWQARDVYVCWHKGITTFLSFFQHYTTYWFHYLTITTYLTGQNQNLVPFIFSCACLYYPMLHKSLHFNLHSYVLYWCWDCQISRRFKFNVICHCQQKMNLEQCSENRKCCWIKFLKDGMGWSFHIKLKAHLKFL